MSLLSSESKKAKLMRQYAGSRIDLSLDDDDNKDLLLPSRSRRNSVRKGSIFVGSKSPSRHRKVYIIFINNNILTRVQVGSDYENPLLPLTGSSGRRKSRRYSTIRGLTAPDEAPIMSKRNSLIPGADKSRRNSCLSPGFSRQRRKSSVRRMSTFDAFMKKADEEDDDDENKLGFNIFLSLFSLATFSFSYKRWKNQTKVIRRKG